MEDRELLELAAKAAALKVHEADRFGLWIFIPSEVERDQEQIVCWNPLDDDGDALRLAVKLSLEIAPSCYVHNCAEVYMQDHNPVVEEYGDDPCAATRRAIVRAAAEIGRTL